MGPTEWTHPRLLPPNALLIIKTWKGPKPQQKENRREGVGKQELSNRFWRLRSEWTDVIWLNKTGTTKIEKANWATSLPAPDSHPTELLFCVRDLNKCTLTHPHPQTLSFEFSVSWGSLWPPDSPAWKPGCWDFQVSAIMPRPISISFWTNTQRAADRRRWEAVKVTQFSDSTKKSIMEEQRISMVYCVWNGLKIKRVGSSKGSSPFPLIINFPFWEKTAAECVYSVEMPQNIFGRSRQLGELGKMTLDRPKQIGYHTEL